MQTIKKKRKPNASLTVWCSSLYSCFTVPNSITLSHLRTMAADCLCTAHYSESACACSRDNMKNKSLCCNHKIVNPFYQLWVALLQCCKSVVQLLKCSHSFNANIILIQAYNMVTKPTVWEDLNSPLLGRQTVTKLKHGCQPHSTGRFKIPYSQTVNCKIRFKIQTTKVTPILEATKTSDT
jgi:hypothetical protein